MSDADNSSFAGFGKLVPGFDFLQNLAKQAAGSAAPKIPQLPNLGNWVAPTLNVEELDKRIEELKTVQFWLDQNAMALKATIQALEVQKMTLATLKGMNFSMGDVASAFKLKVADTAADSVKNASEKSNPFSGLEVPPTSYDKGVKAEKKDNSKSGAAAATAAPAAGVVDPMQWWGALTQQFQNIATTAMQDAASQTAMNTTRTMATGLAKDAMKSATDMASGLAKGMADPAGKTAARGVRSAMNVALRSAQAWPTPVPAKTASPAKPKTPARKTNPKTTSKTTSKTVNKSDRKTAPRAGR